MQIHPTEQKSSKFPPVRQSKQGKDACGSPNAFHVQNCDIQQGDPTNESPCQCICKTEKIKNPAGVQAFFENFSFFCRILNFFAGWEDFLGFLAHCRAKSVKRRQEIQRLRAIQFSSVRWVGYWRKFLRIRWEGTFPNGNRFFHFFN